MNVTKTIPIIILTGSDPVARGFVASLTHPGGNVTGVSYMLHELIGKRLELLKEVVPDALTKLLSEKRLITQAEFSQKLLGPCGVSAQLESHGTIVPSSNTNVLLAKAHIFLLAFNIIGVAEPYLLRDMGLAWLVPPFLL